MAQVTSPITLKGQIGNLIFSTRNGKTIAYQKPSFCIKKWRKSKSTKWARVSAQNFGGAAKCGSAIYKALSIGTTKGVFRPYSHNYIAKKLRANVYRSQPAADHYDLATARRALRNLDLSSEESNSNLVQFKNIGPTHSPTQTTITGLKEAAYEIDPQGQQNLECRITRRTLRFPEVKYNKQAWEWRRTNPAQIRQHQEDLKSEWFHIDHIPQEGIKLNLSNQKEEPKEASLVFFIIEWRTSLPYGPVATGPQSHESTASRRRMPNSRPLAAETKYKHLKKQSIIKLATIRLTTIEAQGLASQLLRVQNLEPASNTPESGLAISPAPSLKAALKGFQITKTGDAPPNPSADG